jgi:hypothetical protein
MKLAMAVAVFAALLASLGQAQTGDDDLKSAVKSCKEIILTEPDAGESYKGSFRNSDYRFTAVIPQHLTAWRGVADEAPFHGFTIFPDGTKQTCIDFDVHIRAGEDTVVQRPAAAKRIALGKAIGWQTRVSGVINGSRMVNITTAFSFIQADQTDDGTIILVAPESRSEFAMKIYDEFVRNLKFGGTVSGKP